MKPTNNDLYLLPCCAFENMAVYKKPKKKLISSKI